MRHFMLDLETLGLVPGSVILTAAVVEFWPDFIGKQPGWFDQSPLCVSFELDESLKEGFTVDADTLRWWMKQDRGIQEKAFAPTHYKLWESLTAIQKYMREEKVDGKVERLTPHRDIRVWGCGADFDVPILASYYERIMETKPWGGFSGRCYRTIRDSFANTGEAVVRTGAHDPVEDCLFQLRRLEQIVLANPGVLKFD